MNTCETADTIGNITTKTVSIQILKLVPLFGIDIDNIGVNLNLMP